MVLWFSVRGYLDRKLRGIKTVGKVYLRYFTTCKGGDDWLYGNISFHHDTVLALFACGWEEHALLQRISILISLRVCYDVMLPDCDAVTSSPAAPSAPCSLCLPCPRSRRPGPRISWPSHRPSRQTRSRRLRLPAMKWYQSSARRSESNTPNGDWGQDPPFSSALTSSLTSSRRSGSVGVPFEEGM